VIGGVPAAATRIDGTSIEDARASNATINGALASPADILILRHPRDGGTIWPMGIQLYFVEQSIVTAGSNSIQ
jgi:hypothetical protein